MTARRARAGLRLVVFLTGLATAATAATAAQADRKRGGRAQGPKAQEDGKARAEFEAGRVAYDGGDYRTAWEHFRQAYLLSKRPQLLYNVGQAADRMGRDDDALKAFRMYLDQMPDADNRREVENRVRALEQRVKAAEMTPSPPPGNQWADPSQPATAQGGSPPDRDGAGATTPAPPPDPDQPGRKGWYFRGALGLALIIDAFSNSASVGGTASGLGGAVDAAAGYAIMDGFVVGGAIMGNLSPGGNVSGDGVDESLDGLTMWMLGPMVDWYLSPHRDGFHVLGALMLTSLSISKRGLAGGAGGETASGGALVLGTGYEFPLGDDLAWGLVGRISAGRLSDSTNSHNALSLALQGSITWY